jgi:hypothetical protein
VPAFTVAFLKMLSRVVRQDPQASGFTCTVVHCSPHVILS